jgi:multidrug resistance efflux pump
MELLLILTYAAICVAVFKIFRNPVNKWTLPTAAFGGIFLIPGKLIMKYNHPLARIYFTTTPIMATVKGRVVEVPVKSNERLWRAADLALDQCLTVTDAESSH